MISTNHLSLSPSGVCLGPTSAGYSAGLSPIRCPALSLQTTCPGPMPSLPTCFLHLGLPLATVSQVLPTPWPPLTLRRGAVTALSSPGIGPAHLGLQGRATQRQGGPAQTRRKMPTGKHTHSVTWNLGIKRKA